MSLEALMEQLKMNSEEIYNRRKESEQVIASMAGQAATMMPQQNRRRGGGNAPGRVISGGNKILGGLMPAVGEANQHNDGYSWAKWSGDINVAGPGDLGNPVRAWRRGKVIDVVKMPDSYGKHIRVRHPNGTESLYAHLSKMKVKVGQRVKRGQVIGKVGNTGNSSGPHLHFEIK